MSKYFMKSVAAWLLLSLCVPAWAGAAMIVSLNVDAKTTRDKEQSVQEKESADGEDRSVTTDLLRETCTLSITIRQSGEESGRCQLEWYFISDNVKNIRDKAEMVVFSKGLKPLTLEKNVPIAETVASQPFDLKRTTQTNSDNDDGLKGDSYKGFVVLVTQEGKILAKTSNSTRFLKDDWIAKCRSFSGKK